MFITSLWSTDGGTIIKTVADNGIIDGGHLVDGGRVTSIMDGGH